MHNTNLHVQLSGIYHISVICHICDCMFIFHCMYVFLHFCCYLALYHQHWFPAPSCSYPVPGSSF